LKHKTLQREKDNLDNSYKELESKSSQLDRDLKQQTELKKIADSEISKLKADLEDLQSKQFA